MATFSDAGCQQPTGNSVATNETLAAFSEFKQGASNLLSEALSLALSIDASFARAQVDENFSGRIQFDDYDTDPFPEINYNSFRFEEPAVPGTVSLEDPRDIDVDVNLPPLNNALILKYIALLCDVLQNLTDGLPAAKVAGIRSRMHDRITRHVLGQKLDFEDDYLRQGWVLPARAIQPRIDALTNLEYRLHALAERDLRIHIYEMSVEVFKAVLSLVLGYFKTWAKVYEAYIDAQSRISDNQIKQNEIAIAELGAAVALFAARSQNERTRLELIAQNYGVDGQLYGAAVAESGAIAGRDATAASLEGDRRTGQARDAVTNADASIGEELQNVQESVANIQNVLATLGRMLAGHYQTLHTGATATSSVSTSSGKSCSTSYSYSETLNSS